MKRFTVVTMTSVLTGIVLGTIARVTMRLITVIEGDQPEFSGAATAGIVGFFALAGLGGGWGGLLIDHPRLGLVIAALATFPVALLGVGIGGGDLVQSVEDQPPATFALIVLATLVIAVCVVASPILSWRRARSGLATRLAA